MEIPLLGDIVAVFGLSIGVLLVCHRLHIPSIVGLLITGVLCGPSALGLVGDAHAVELLAEVGIVLLLFTIGMELSGEELARLRKPVFVGGTTQVVMGVLIFGLLYSLQNDRPWQQGVFYGCLTALSSTAIVLSLLQQKGLSESPQGRLSLSVLVFQDIAIVPMMLAIPLLAGSATADAWELLLSAVRTLGILGGGWLLARYAVPRLMRYVVRTRSRELLLTSTLALCLAIALGTAHLGLSLSLGAFLAGLLLAESEYSLNVIEGVLPFKEVFTSLFFISVGMLLDIRFFLTHLDMVLIWAAIIILLKILLTIPAILVLGYPLRVAILTAMSLAQIGEFSFVLAGSGLAAGLLDQKGYQLFLAGSILTMTMTPVLLALAPRVADAVAARLHARGADDNAEPESVPGLHDHLIIVGFGVGGKHLARTARETCIPYVILEMNPDTVTRYRKEGEPILHGDASSPLVLEHVNIRNARVISVVISDPAAVRGITDAARHLNPRVHIVVRTRFLGEVAELRALGADDVIPEDFETSMEIFTRVLEHYLVPRQTIEQFVHLIRSENYAMTRKLDVGGTDLPSLHGAALGDVQVAAFNVEEGSSVAGRLLADSGVRAIYGVTVVGIRRGDMTIASPDGAAELLTGDVVYLFGSPDALGLAMEAFCPQPAP